MGGGGQGQAEDGSSCSQSEKYPIPELLRASFLPSRPGDSQSGSLCGEQGAGSRCCLPSFRPGVSAPPSSLFSVVGRQACAASGGGGPTPACPLHRRACTDRPAGQQPCAFTLARPSQQLSTVYPGPTGTPSTALRFSPKCRKACSPGLCKPFRSPLHSPARRGDKTRFLCVNTNTGAMLCSRLPAPRQR